MSSPDIAGILDNSRELDRLRKEQQEVLMEINKLHKKLQAAPELVEKPGDSSLSKLKKLYIQAKELSANEGSIYNALLSQLGDPLSSGPPGQQKRKPEGSDQKRKRTKEDSNMSRLFTSLQACASLKGEQVAARVTQEDNDEWFIMKMIHFDRGTKLFEVLDEVPLDDEETAAQRNDPSTIADFPPGKHVLAVYPGTTALYKATVVSTPRKRKSHEYVLEFDDDEEDGSLPQRTVPFYRVVALPEGHRQ